MISASFLLSQVPDDCTHTGDYAAYAEAHGTAGECTVEDTMAQNTDCTTATAGACTDQWPAVSVWKTSDCESMVALQVLALLAASLCVGPSLRLLSTCGMWSSLSSS